eukprot:3146138-Prymnesium_polylepis.1
MERNGSLVPASALESISTFTAWLLRCGDPGTSVAKAVSSDAPKENESTQLPGGLDSLCLLGSVVCTKQSAIGPTANNLLRSLGLHGAMCVSPRMLGLSGVPFAGSENSFDGAVGERLFFRPATSPAAHAAVPLCLLFNQCVSPFVKQLDAQARASAGAKAYILVPSREVPPTNAASSAAVSSTSGSSAAGPSAAAPSAAGAAAGSSAAASESGTESAQRSHTPCALAEWCLRRRKGACERPLPPWRRRGRLHHRAI